MKRVFSFFLCALVIFMAVPPQHSSAARDRGAAPGPWRFLPVYSYDLGTSRTENNIVTADFDKDGSLDIALLETMNPIQSKVILLHNQGGWQFAPTLVGGPYTGYGTFIGAADMNGDTWTDLVIFEGGRMRVFLNNQAGGFTLALTWGSSFNNGWLADVNGDGAVDVLNGAQGSSGGFIEVFLNDGSGRSFMPAWKSAEYGSTAGTITALFAANLDGDAHADIAAVEIYTGLLLTFSGDGTGKAFTLKTSRPLGERTFSLACGDIDHNGLMDMAAYVGWGAGQVFLTGADASLTPYWTSPNLLDSAFNLSLADFDQDGALDLFAGTYNGAARIYRGDPALKFTPAWAYSLSGIGDAGLPADLNGDTYPDLIVGARDPAGKATLQVLRSSLPQGISLFLPLVGR